MQAKIAKNLRLKGYDSVFFISHLLIVLLSYSIYLAPHIAPTTFPYFGFVPIFFPLIVLFNLILIVIVFFRRKVYAMVFLILSIGLFLPLGKTYNYFGKKVEIKPDFKLITFNGHYLRDADIETFELFFESQNADVILLQEVDKLIEHRSEKKKFKELKDSIFSDYFHERNYGNQIFSKYPIIEFQPIYSYVVGTSPFACYADLDTGRDTIRIINVHLESMSIDKELKEGITNTNNLEKNSKVLKNNMVRAFLSHQSQIQSLLPFIQNSPYPVILAGDLNSVPYSYEYQQLSYWIKDTYLEVGKSSGTSYNDFNFPLRIDYIFHSEEFLPINYKVLKGKKLSDHDPVVAEFKLLDNNIQ